MIVLGGALLVLGILFFVVSAIVSSAVSAGGSACASPPCRSVDPGPWFAWIGLPFVLVGLGLLLLGLYWTIR